MVFIIPENTPILDLGDRQGETEYIDFIEWNEVTSPVMTGVDKFNRQFIVIKATIDDVETPLMQTFFQRYSDNTHDNNFWISDFRDYFIDTDGGMTKEQIQLIQDLINGKNPTIEWSHHPYYYLSEGKQVRLLSTN